MKDELSPMLQQSMQNHKNNANRDGVHYHVGQVFRHKKFGYRVRLPAEQPANDAQTQGSSEICGKPSLVRRRDSHTTCHSSGLAMLCLCKLD
jgi:hypothetical protein